MKNNIVSIVGTSQSVSGAKYIIISEGVYW